MPRMKITLERTGILAVPRSKLRDAFREGIRMSGLRWWQEYLPIHFTERAVGRYRYKHRDLRYNKLKREKGEINGVRAIGDTSPNVFTGHSKEVATQVQNIQAIATSADKVRCEVIINAPALNFGANKRINMREEVTTLIKSEIDDLTNVYASESQKALERMGRTERIVKRIAA